MIVKMKKVTLLCLPSDKESALEKLRELGVMHTNVTERPDSEDFVKLEQEKKNIEQAIIQLKIRDNEAISAETLTMSGKEVCEKVIELLDKEAILKKQLESLRRDYDRLYPWGNFSLDTLKDIQGSGLHVYLCSGKEQDLQLLPESVIIEEVSEYEENKYFVVISKQQIDEKMLPLATVPEEYSLQELTKLISKSENELEENELTIAKLVGYIPKLEEYQLEVEEELEFVQNKDSMKNEGVIEHISGFVPVTEVDKLNEVAKDNGWGLLIVDPAEDEQVPTLVKVPKIFSVSKPIFDFMGISPGYHEVDCSVVFLIFFTTFFSMIIGDGGYGCLFLTAAIFAKIKLAKNKEAQPPIKLFMLLSISTIIWGFLTGNFFGLVNSPEAAAAGQFQWPDFMNGLDWFKSDKNIQFLCFSIAVTHLTIAHLWSAITKINSKAAVGEIGWILLVIGAFFVICDMVVGMPIISMATAGTFLIAPGVVLMLLFSVNWKDIGDILNFPFGVMGGFIDSLSYIRLFAVGLAGYQVAKSFNNMGFGIMEMNNIIGYVGGALVIFMGHALNIALCIMGVLVHGIRLNTLEFSGHLNLEWAGVAFKPFKKLKTNNN